MAQRYTVDASVFLNAFNPYETGHAASARFLALAQAQALPLIVPALLLPELAATVSRGRQDAALARRFAATIAQLPHLVLTPVDLPLARQAAEAAALYRLRGSDAVYAAVALRFGCTLVSLDKEQLERLADALLTYRPETAVAELLDARPEVEP